jgi:hypothetical protein
MKSLMWRGLTQDDRPSANLIDTKGLSLSLSLSDRKVDLLTTTDDAQKGNRLVEINPGTI